jgi:hypothetical protein
MMKNLLGTIFGKSGKAILPIAFLTTSLMSFTGRSPSPVPAAAVITKNLNNKKHIVRLFTASDDKTLLFRVDGVDGKRYTLFVFDLDSKLVMQSVIGSHETGILPQISTGIYLYEVLSDDTRVESGQLKVK